MTEAVDLAMTAQALATTPVSRRGFFATCGAVSAAGAAASVAGPAWAATTGMRTYEGAYALGAHNLVFGYFANPRGKTDLDVVVIVPDKGRVTAKTRALARQHAAQGRMAVVPDLLATYGKAALGGVPAMTAALMADKARYRRLPLGSNRVTFVAA